MSVLDLLRKGLGYVFLTMGVSRPAPKPRPAAAPESGSGGGAPDGDRGTQGR